MESLKEYVEKLHFHTFDYFLEILHQFYTSEELADLDGKLEFSLLLNKDAPLSFRFGLFQLHDAGAITTLFNRYGYDTSALESSISIMKGFASEYGFGLDWNEQDPRFKVYFLRLPDNPEFRKKIDRKIITLAEVNRICPDLLQPLKKDDCYLVCVDYHRSNRRNLKVYTKTLEVNHQKICSQLGERGISSKFLGHFARIFTPGLLKEVTHSYKYSSHSTTSSGLSIFFEVAPKSNKEINMLIETCLPNRFNEFRDVMSLLETKYHSVHYSHVGVTFSLHPFQENICLYYSPDFRGIVS